MAEEKMFFNDGGVTVSNSRMMYDGKTYAMSGVTSVKSWEKSPSRKGPIIMIAIGLLFLAAGKSGIIMALILIGGGIAWWISQKSDFSVMLTSASGETQAYTSTDKSFVNSIINAINESIVHRG